MGRHSGRPARAVRLDAGRLAAVVPVAVLVASAVAAASAPVAPAGNAVAAGAGAASAPAPEAVPDVPDRAVESPASVTASDGVAPALELPAPVTADGSPASGRVRIDSDPIPARALQAYRHSERLLRAADPACNLDWALVAAIGKVESNHGRFGGNGLDAAGVARPGIYGIPLDGRPGVAAIRDSDGGRLDRDTTWDRAVGPMQFIPGTWRSVGSDAEPDGVRDPQDIDDASAATGVYLCSGPGDLRTAADRYQAVYRYNRSDSYVRTVMAIAAAYARGESEVSAAALPAARVGRTAAAGQPASQPAQPAPAPAPAPEQTQAPSGGQAPPPPAQPRPSTPPSTASDDPVPGTVGAVTGAVGQVVGGAAPAPAPVPPEAPTSPVALVVATLPGPGQRCVDAAGNPVELVLGLCPVGAYLTP